jgi:hypothetical protein
MFSGHADLAPGLGLQISSRWEAKMSAENDGFVSCIWIVLFDACRVLVIAIICTFLVAMGREIKSYIVQATHGCFGCLRT